MASQSLITTPVAIVGPTASGKTELALALARRLGGEVISADSRQIYRGLDAGTAKPALDRDGRADGIPYHLIDVVAPEVPFDAGRYAALARPLLEETRRRGRRPIVAGGTGLYVRALLEGLSEMPGRDEQVRGRLESEARLHGREALHRRLARVDPAAARAIPVNNIQRLIRALEVHELTGRPISSYWDKRPLPIDRGGGLSPGAPPAPAEPGAGRRRSNGGEWKTILIEWPREELDQRIADRAERFWPRILSEVAQLAKRYDGGEPGFQSLGYREAFLCLRGELSPDQGLAQMIRSTRAYAKRQRTWFRNQCGGGAPSESPGESVRGGDVDSMLRQALAILE